MALHIDNKYYPGKSSGYLVAGNLSNCFAIGDVGSETDFFLVGSEPESESIFPLFTGNILDPSGNVLCRIMRNKIIYNPGNCERYFGDHVSFEIRDGNGEIIFKTRTAFDSAEGLFITTLTGNFYDKEGKLVYKATGGEKTEELAPAYKSVFGYNGSYGYYMGYNDDELLFISMVFVTGGKVHMLITGEYEDLEFFLDGNALNNVKIRNSKLHIKTGEFFLFGDNSFENCSMHFHDQAANVKSLYLTMLEGQGLEIGAKKLH